MQHTPLFIGLTREVSFAGLPILYLVVLLMIVMLGFILSGSFLYLLVSAIGGYAALRALAAYDPKIIGVILTALKSTPMSPALIRGEKVVYRA